MNPPPLPSEGLRPLQIPSNRLTNIPFLVWIQSFPATFTFIMEFDVLLFSFSLGADHYISTFLPPFLKRGQWCNFHPTPSPRDLRSPANCPRSPFPPLFLPFNTRCSRVLPPFFSFFPSQIKESLSAHVDFYFGGISLCSLTGGVLCVCAITLFFTEE